MKAGAIACVVPLPGALVEPLKQPRRGRLPKAVVSIWRARFARSEAARAVALQMERADMETRCRASFKIIMERTRLVEEAEARLAAAHAEYSTLNKVREELKAEIAKLATNGGVA